MGITLREKIAQLPPERQAKIKERSAKLFVEESARQLIYILVEISETTPQYLQLILCWILPHFQTLIELENASNPQNSKAFQAYLESKKEYLEIYRRLAES